MNPNLKNVTGLAVCTFCGAGDHAFSKEHCQSYIEENIIYKRKLKTIHETNEPLFQKTIKMMGYNEMELVDDINKKIDVIDIMKYSGDNFSKDQIKCVENYIKLIT